MASDQPQRENNGRRTSLIIGCPVVRQARRWLHVAGFNQATKKEESPLDHGIERALSFIL
jgi:hypothetical protein